MRPIAVALVASALLATCGGADRVLVGAGTTLVDSGLMAELADRYAADTGTRISVVAGSSAEVLELLARNEVVAAITHVRDLEAAYLEAHPGATGTAVFASEFVLAGPADRVAVLEGMDAPNALAAIAERGWTFVSRADGSGTFAREVELWDLAGVDPAGAGWYVETGQGMGETLQVADQRVGFVLSELGTLLGAEGIELVPVVLAGDPALLMNPYTLMIDDPSSAPAAALAEWLTSTAGREAISGFGEARYGRSLYVPPGD